MVAGEGGNCVGHFQPACVHSTRSSKLCQRRWSSTEMGWEMASWMQSTSMSCLRFRVLWLAPLEQSTSKLVSFLLLWKVLEMESCCWVAFSRSGFELEMGIVQGTEVRGGHG